MLGQHIEAPEAHLLWRQPARRRSSPPSTEQGYWLGEESSACTGMAISSRCGFMVSGVKDERGRDQPLLSAASTTSPREKEAACHIERWLRHYDDLCGPLQQAQPERHHAVTLCDPERTVGALLLPDPTTSADQRLLAMPAAI